MSNKEFVKAWDHPRPGTLKIAEIRTYASSEPDRDGKRLSDCKRHFSSDAPAFGGFPAAELIK